MNSNVAIFMSICAYCKQEGVLTREHVVPAFAYAFQKELESSVIGWNEAAGKMVGGELKIKDVCAACNNGVLSTLDSSGKALLVDSGILTSNFTKLSLMLSHDYDLLARWLLKISYNSSRTDGEHSHLFEKFVPYILGKETTPSRAKISILAYLAGPTYPNEEDRQRPPYAKVIGPTNRFNPFLVRISYGFVRGGNNYTLRLVILGPLVFYMLVFNDSVLPGHAAAAVRHFLKVSPGAVELKPSRGFVELNAGRRSWIDLYENQVNRARALQREGSG